MTGPFGSDAFARSISGSDARPNDHGELPFHTGRIHAESALRARVIPGSVAYPVEVAPAPRPEVEPVDDAEVVDL